MLVDVQETSTMGLFPLIMEGNLAHAIRWAEDSYIGPSRIGPWLDEMKDISIRLNGSFSHILRGANIVKGAPAKGSIWNDVLSSDL